MVSLLSSVLAIAVSVLAAVLGQVSLLPVEAAMTGHFWLVLMLIAFEVLLLVALVSSLERFVCCSAIEC